MLIYTEYPGLRSEKSADSARNPRGLSMWRSLRRLRADSALYRRSGCGPSNRWRHQIAKAPMGLASQLHADHLAQLFLASATAHLPRAISNFLRTAASSKSRPNMDSMNDPILPGRCPLLVRTRLHSKAANSTIQRHVPAQNSQESHLSPYPNLLPPAVPDLPGQLFAGTNLSVPVGDCP